MTRKLVERFSKRNFSVPTWDFRIPVLKEFEILKRVQDDKISRILLTFRTWFGIYYIYPYLPICQGPENQLSMTEFTAINVKADAKPSSERLNFLQNNVKIDIYYNEDWFMIKIKRAGFTLAEVLITLAVVGTVAILVLPGLIKDTNNKAMMANLQSAVSTLNNAVQNELITKGARTIDDTDIKSAPETFLQTLDVSRISKTDTFADSYKSMNGTAVTVPSVDAAATLKNGVAIGLKKFTNPNANIYTGNNTNMCDIVYIDTNGKNSPNIAGVDLFILKLSWGNTLLIPGKDLDLEHLGDLGAFPGGTVGSSTGNPSNSQLKTNCKGGNAAACYLLAERTGFDPNYIENAE